MYGKRMYEPGRIQETHERNAEDRMYAKYHRIELIYPGCAPLVGKKANWENLVF